MWFAKIYTKPLTNFQNYLESYLIYILNINPKKIVIGLIQMAKINISVTPKILV